MRIDVEIDGGGHERASVGHVERAWHRWVGRAAEIAREEMTSESARLARFAIDCSSGCKRRRMG